MGGSLLPRVAGGDILPPLLDGGMVIKRIFEALGLQHVSGVGKEGKISESEVTTSEVLGLLELVLKNIKERVQLLLQSRDLRFVSLLTIEGRTEEELDNNVNDGTRVGLL